MIRILHVVTIMDLGGLENYLMNLYRSLDRSKFQFDFLVHRQDRGYFDEEIESLGGKIYRLNPITPTRFFSYKKELKAFFRKFPEYQIVHSHVNENSMLVLSVAEKIGIPVRIAHSHASATTSKYKYLREIMIKRLTKYSTANFACSVSAGNWLFKSSPFVVRNNGIDIDRFRFDDVKRCEFRKALNINGNDVVIGNVARFSKVKNHEFLLKVFSLYHKRNPESKLLLIGDGDLKKEIESQVINLRLSEKVIFTGAINNPHDYLNVMDLFVFPSIFEGLGIVLVEAQCNGLPTLFSEGISKEVIVTDIAYQKSLSDPEVEWVKRIEELMDNRENRINYFPFVAENGYDVKRNVQVLQEYYTNSLEKL